jgi:hypothetical protein
MHFSHRPPHEVPINKASSGPPLRILGLSIVTLSSPIAHISKNQVFLLGFVLDLFTASRSVHLRMNVVGARRHQILRHRISLQHHGHLLEHSFRQSTAETCVLDLLDQRLGLDVRKERRPRDPVHDQLPAFGPLCVGPQKFREKIFEQHLLVATGEVGYHQVDHFVAENLILQSCRRDVEIAELEKDFRCSERWIEGCKVARAIEPKRVALQDATRQVSAKNKDASCDLAFAVKQLIGEESRVVAEKVAVNANCERAWAFDDDDLVERTSGEAC